MNESEAIKWQQQIKEIYKGLPRDIEEDMNDSCNIAIKALDEIQKYQSLGTVEECRAALEKQEKIKEVIENANQWSKEDVFVKAQAFCDIEKIGVNSNEKQKS